MSFWANYFSSIFQTQRLFCYSVAIASINAIDSANKKSFSALPQQCGLGSLTAVSPPRQGGIPLPHRTGRLASCTVNSQSDGRGNSSVQLVAWDESAPILPRRSEINAEKQGSWVPQGCSPATECYKELS